MEGSILTFDKITLNVIKERIETISKSVSEGLGCKAEVHITDGNPPVINHPVQTERVIEVCNTYFGSEHFSQESLPLHVSEDFAHYLNKKPGCFFGIGTMRPEQDVIEIGNS